MSWIVEGVILLLLITAIVILGLSYLDTTWTPPDDGRTFVESIFCEGTSCNITFKYNVSGIWQVPGTGSDVPVTGGKDWVVCLNGTEVVKNNDIRVGDLITNNAYMHFVEDKGLGWIKTRGSNNLVSDPYRTPMEGIICVIGLVGR